MLCLHGPPLTKIANVFTVIHVIVYLHLFLPHVMFPLQCFDSGVDNNLVFWSGSAVALLHNRGISCGLA